MTPAYLRRDFRIRLLALIGILGLVNYLLAGQVWRVDLTRDKIYTLSDASVRLMEGLQQPVHVKAYFTRDLQPPYSEFEQVVRDKLDEYAAHARGRLNYEFKDPTGNPELEEEARRFGITAAKIDFRARDQREIKTAYLGVAFVTGDKQEVLPIVRNLDGLEYDITRTLKGLTSETEKKTIGFLLGHGEPDLLRPPHQGGVNPLRMALEERYAVTSVDQSTSPDIPENVDSLLVLAPTQEIPPRHQFEIDQFLMAGKTVGFLVPSHLADMRSLKLNPLSHGLAPLLEHYGVKLSSDLVLDRQRNAPAQFPVRQGRMTFQALVNYPLYPLATTFDRESVIVRDVDVLPMPMTQGLSLTEAVSGKVGMTLRTLISSSEFSSMKAPGALPPLDPQVLMDAQQAEGERPGPFALAYTLEGPFGSFWADKPLPGEEGELSGRSVVKESPPTRMLVVGGAEFVRGGGEVLLNMLDWLAQDEDLISIRSKGESRPPLEVVEDGTQKLIGLANAAGIPLLFILFGLLRWQLRRRSQDS